MTLLVPTRTLFDLPVLQAWPIWSAGFVRRITAEDEAAAVEAETSSRGDQSPYVAALRERQRRRALIIRRAEEPERDPLTLWDRWMVIGTRAKGGDDARSGDHGNVVGKKAGS